MGYTHRSPVPLIPQHNHSPSKSLLHTGFTALIVLLDCSHPTPSTNHLHRLYSLTDGGEAVQWNPRNQGHTRGDATCAASGMALGTPRGLDLVQETVALWEGLLHTWRATCITRTSSPAQRGGSAGAKQGKKPHRAIQAEGRMHLQVVLGSASQATTRRTRVSHSSTSAEPARGPAAVAEKHGDHLPFSLLQAILLPTSNCLLCNGRTLQR